MDPWYCNRVLAGLAHALVLACAVSAPAQPHAPFILPEQRSVDVREPWQLSTAGVPDVPPPRTVARPGFEAPKIQLSLDDAIRIALENSEVVRFLAGATATSSGRTVYDVAISNSGIDEQQARFDPSLSWRHDFSRNEMPSAFIDPTVPSFASIGGLQTDAYNMNSGLSKTTMTGGTLNLGVNTNPARFQPGLFALNPQNRYSLDMSYTQPLWRGGGFGANRAPIIVARIDTERSYFQFKDGVQEMVRGVIDAYWALVFARTDVWARRQQVEQAKFAYDRAQARFEEELANQSEVALTRVTWGNFRANLIAAESNMLQQEAALRNILGLPPEDGKRLVPISPPASERQDFDWPRLIQLAEEYRPDVIELKMIIEADEQLLLLARNQANPNVDATMLYRWNGLEGKAPTGANLSTSGGQFTDWSMGVNFSVPLFLRQERAAMRRQELVLARDRANLRQSLHNMTHILATNLRSLDQFYEQYLLFKEVRAAAADNLSQQWEEYRNGRVIFLNVLQAITDWGNAVSAEANSLAQFNVELANLERQTGTILESHGIRFFEERYGSVGPLWHDRAYPEQVRPATHEERYPRGAEPSENFFDLDSPILQRQEELPPPIPNVDDNLPEGANRNGPLLRGYVR